MFNRPPEPTDIPFTFDRSKCNYEILKWHEIELNQALQSTRKIFEPDGDPVTLTTNTTGVFIKLDKTIPDPNGVVYEYKWDFRAQNGLGVYYIDFTAKDDKGKSDQRTVLVNVVEKLNKPPLIID